MTSAVPKAEEGREEDRACGAGRAVLSGTLRGGVTAKVTSEHRCEGGDGKSHVGLSAKGVPGRKTSKLKRPKKKQAWKESSMGKRGRRGVRAGVGPPVRKVPAGSRSEQDGSHGKFPAEVNTKGARHLLGADQRGGSYQIQTGDAGLDRRGASVNGALVGILGALRRQGQQDF